MPFGLGDLVQFHHTIGSFWVVNVLEIAKSTPNGGTINSQRVMVTSVRPNGTITRVSTDDWKLRRVMTREEWLEWLKQEEENDDTPCPSIN